MNTAGPYTAEIIGRTFGQHGSHPNKGLQLIGHALNSGVSAAVNGGSFAAGAVSGAGSEPAVKALTQTLYGKEAAADPGALGEKEKTLVSGLSAAFGAVSGGLAGGSALNAQIGAVAGKNAVENNYLLANPKAELLKTSGCKTKAECERLRRLYERGEMTAAKNIGAPVVDTFLATLFPAYDFGSSYAQADTSEEKMLAFIALVPGEKLGRTAANALEKTVDLLKNGKTSEAYRYFQVMADGLKHDHVPLAMAADSGNVRIPKGGIPSQAMASKGNKAGTIGNNTRGEKSKGSSIPVPEPRKIVLTDGSTLTYHSNPKHTPGNRGSRQGLTASIEPSNSIVLFKNSVPSKAGARVAYDKDTNTVHQFFSDADGKIYHWSGTLDRNRIDKLNIETRRKLGIPGK
ncbi:VENN motif pre-toxin domain-containing protein [Neisseria musculi]|uniref:Pre-toxin domain with VENN motif family protein n=1 Tax=Neisseria musculi TaxID=1815583 RepID=A0A7H1MCL3_9NEIS|nr:VENN motif pre-toxin domain-containing protein [Neisseria musculi]QNT59378.1 pre-toxin domain with VENN motif family protein [Neisseria musculi]